MPALLTVTGRPNDTFGLDLSSHWHKCSSTTSLVLVLLVKIHALAHFKLTTITAQKSAKPRQCQWLLLDVLPDKIPKQSDSADSPADSDRDFKFKLVLAEMPSALGPQPPES
jgi:hypothetical protein